MNIIYKTTTSSIKYPCRMCLKLNDQVFAEIEHPDPTYDKLFISKCINCESINYMGDDPVLGYQNESFADNYWVHYTHVGAGITGMLEPLFALGEKARGSLLDVGCGFGYIVDFWNKLEYGDAIGLEKAIYGEIGARLLSCPIYPDYYEDCDAVKNRKFDIVFSSEVLEHIKNPQSFIHQISQALSPDGILVMTTPSADAVDTKYTSSDTIAALSPYFHYFLASEKALKKLLNECGFEHVYIYNSGKRLFAWASQSILPVIKIGEIAWENYFTYLNILANNDEKNIKSGALYRLFKDAWNTGREKLAIKAFNELEKVAEVEYNLSLRYPEIKRYLLRNSPIANLTFDPAWYGVTLLFGGMMIGRFENDQKTKIRMLDAATEILGMESTRIEFEQFAQEVQHFYPYSKDQLQLAYEEILK